MAKRNIYLAGFMGAGKSTIGRELARVLGRKFIDVDSALEQRHGCTVPEMFANYGEAWFREQEHDLCLEIAHTCNRVVATGGGTLLDDEVFAAFQDSGLILCLYAQRECLLERLSRNERRPLLRDGDLEERVDSLMQQRQALYERIRIHVDTTSLTPMETARKIADMLKTRQRILDQLLDQYIDLC